MLDLERPALAGRCLFVIFGGTGDLTRRKLIPAVYRLTADGSLPDGLDVVAVGRREKSPEEFRLEMRDAVHAFGKGALDEAVLEAVLGRIHYRQFDFIGDDGGYDRLDEFLSGLSAPAGAEVGRLYYLAVAPEHFAPIVRNLHMRGMLEEIGGWRRVMVEKPFGTNLESARALNREISSMLPESRIFRIDHYLGKEMIQNILAMRFGNSLFEPLWNNHHIDSIQITSTEMLGVENRGGYYEGAGILKDMLQNHIMQMLSLLAMEPPVDLSPESIRDEKVKVLRSLRPISRDAAVSEIVRGQYGPGERDGKALPGYRQEDRVSPGSMTDTFIALRLHIDNFRWSGVPIYVRAGKRMDRQLTSVAIQFRHLPGTHTYREFRTTEPNLLVLYIQPREGFFFRINAKRPGSEFAMEPVQMDYCQSCRIERNSPEAYERLILEAIRNNPALFTRWDELEASWRYIEGIEQAWRGERASFPNYAAGSSGPEDAFALLERDGRSWLDDL